jgi:hypothetical protein
VADQIPPEDVTDEHAPFEEPRSAGQLPADELPRLGAVGDLVRRAVMAGVGAVFLTEEGIRKTVSELKLPKEALGYLTNQADRTRREASRIVRKELRRFLNSEAFRDQVAHFLSGMTLEIKAEIRIKPQEGGPKPEVDATMNVKSASPSKS